jgi:hypothetical protein
LVHVQVAAERSPENALKGGNAFAGNNTGNETNVHDGKGSVRCALSLAVLLDVLQKWGIVVIE